MDMFSPFKNRDTIVKCDALRRCFVNQSPCINRVMNFTRKNKINEKFSLKTCGLNTSMYTYLCLLTCHLCYMYCDRDSRVSHLSENAFTK